MQEKNPPLILKEIALTNEKIAEQLETKTEKLFKKFYCLFNSKGFDKKRYFNSIDC